MTGRSTVLASIVLALALLGDSLLYAVLPVHAATFGISLAWVGVLLSANRIVRLFAYPLLPHVAAAGLRRFTIAAAALGGVTTLTFAVAGNAWVLLASRVAWGIVFGALSLSALAYATERHEVAGRRVGLSLALREVGPLTSLTIGAAAVSIAGLRPTLAVLGMISWVGVVVAMRLPELRIVGDGRRESWLRMPRAADWLSLTAGFVTDGVFPATIALLIAHSAGAGDAVIGAGLLLGIKRVAVVMFAPVTGHASDRFGGRSVAAVGFGIAAAGAVLITIGVVIAGAIFISCGAAITTAAIPVIVVTAGEERVAAFARMAMARDVGAAAGPFVALLYFDAAGVRLIYSASAVLLAAMATWLVARPVAVKNVVADSFV